MPTVIEKYIVWMLCTIADWVYLYNTHKFNRQRQTNWLNFNDKD